MAEYNSPIIVPWDFTEKAEYALLHAVNYSRIINKDIILLHIVKKDKEVEPALKILEEKTNDYKKEFDVPIHAMVKAGTIFSTITEVINDLQATMAVMGTHGRKGLQKLLGSWALKVITGSQAPFIVVQAPPKESEKDVKEIVVPIDFRLENKQKLVWINFLSKLFHTKFYLCYIEDPDRIAKKRIYGNIKVAIEFMDEKGIAYDIKKLEGSDLADETIEFAHKIDAAMIMVTTTRNPKTLDFMFGAEEQKIIANKYEIPVMTINPREGFLKYQSFN